MPAQRSCLCLLLACLFAAIPLTAASPQVPDVLGGEIVRLRSLMASPVSVYRIEGAQGAADLRLQTFEPNLLSLLKDKDPLVRREAIQALSQCGTWRSIHSLIATLTDPDWQLSSHTRLALCRMTGQSFGASKRDWEQWWKSSTCEEKQDKLLSVFQGNDREARLSAARALRCMATPVSEDRILVLLTGQKPVSGGERKLLTEALDRIGTAKSMPYFLKQAAGGNTAAAWALGSRGGKEAEEALLKGLRRSNAPDFVFNLDRVKSTRCGPLLRRLCAGFPSLINSSLRSDDVTYPLRPQHRAAANLIRRSGRGQELVDRVLAEMEGKRSDKPIPKDLKSLVEDLRKILKPGFIREGFGGCAALLSAFYYVADDKALAPRLIPLLKSDCTIVRIYAALTLGKLRAPEAVGPILAVIKGGYPFCDSTALASGKHTASFRVINGKRQRQSQTIRWLGYLCMALGRIGNDEARLSLEVLAADAASPRDVRYGAVIGLGFIGSPKSLPILRKVENTDIIWMISDRARRTIRDIEIAGQIKTAKSERARKY
ncbi:MAG: HEAT repeat domain-containing protein [Planctomycetes bacterium]|nr:HEAT repeat domain-containing protein [Planctomycetota bacterium]